MLYFSGNRISTFNDEVAVSVDFKSDINAMDKCINYANHFLVMNGQMTLNDIYEIIGLESTTLGDYFTYYASDDLIEINYSSKLTSDNEPCVVMQFSTLPRFEDR